MVVTPWGDTDRLRGRRLAPGPGAERETVRQNQRERLFAALVATVAERGYEATRIEDLVELSGVSRRTFYSHFADKRECFCAALEALVGDGVALVRANYDGEGDWEAGVRGGLAAFLQLLVTQPAAAKVCFAEIYAAGPEAVAILEGAFDRFGAIVEGGLAGVPEMAGMPTELVGALLGGLRNLIQSRLLAARSQSLGELAGPLFSWALSYRPPPQPLRRPRRGGPIVPMPAGEEEVAERILWALATEASEHGYPETTVAQIAARAHVSLATFYSYFEGKEAAMLAALDSGTSRLLAAMLPAYRRGADWPHGVRLALGAMLNFSRSEPGFARLAAVEVYGAGPAALAARERTMAGLRELISSGLELEPTASPLAAEAIAASIRALVYAQLRRRGAAALPEIAPLATYVALCPFLGADAAVEVANGDGRKR